MIGGHDLYILQMGVTGDVKIGRSSNVERRQTEIQTGCPHPLRLVLHGPGLGHLESKLHKKLQRYRTRRRKGEWFHEECLAELPVEIYDLIPEAVLEDPDWWKHQGVPDYLR